MIFAEKAFRVDEQGFYLEDIPFPTEEDLFNPLVVSAPIPDGLYRPRWNRVSQRWVGSVVEKSLAQLKLEKINELSLLCRTAIRAGFESDALGAVHTYDSNTIEDQVNLIGTQPLAIAGLSVAYVCTDKAGLKEARLHTPEQMQKVFADGALKKQEYLVRFHQLRLLVEQADSAETLESIQW
jgi:hypothetical protein